MIFLLLYGYSFYWPRVQVRLADTVIRVVLADIPKHLFQGWSGVSSMGKLQGMLFLFPTRDDHVMVMRDMQFPLDIVWIDESSFSSDPGRCGLQRWTFRHLLSPWRHACRGVVVDIAPRLPPEAGRNESDLTMYQARLPSTMVLELPAGFTTEHGVKVGDVLEVME